MTPKQQQIWRWSLPVLVLVIFAIVLWLMVENKPKAESRKDPIKRPKVFVVAAQQEMGVLSIQSQGEVRPIASVELRPEISGRLIFVSDQLVTGGQFSEGEILARIDPEPFELAVVQKKASVAQAEQQYLLAQAESEAAIEELNDLKKTSVNELAKGLPQLRRAKAQLESALADLERAKLELSYTNIVAPFNGRVEKEEVSAGQYINRNALVASVYSTEKIEVKLPLTLRQLQQVGIAVDYDRHRDEMDMPVYMSADLGGKTVHWRGYVARTEAMIDSRTRTITVVAEMEKPYAAKVPLLIGTFVQAEIKGRIEHPYSRLPIRALRNGQDLWLVNDKSLLKIVPVNILQRNREEVLVSGLADDTLVVTSTLPLPSDGLRVNIVNNENDENGESSERVAQKKNKKKQKQKQSKESTL